MDWVCEVEGGGLQALRTRQGIMCFHSVIKRTVSCMYISIIASDLPN